MVCVVRDESEPASITDPDATQPEDWLEDEPMLTPDPDAEKPADWSVTDLFSLSTGVNVQIFLWTSLVCCQMKSYVHVCILAHSVLE